MTQVALADRIRTTVEIRSGFQTIEPGTEGHVFDTHATPDRSYLIDLGEGSTPRYTVLFPGEFEVVGRGTQDGPGSTPPDLLAPRLTARGFIPAGVGGSELSGPELSGPELELTLAEPSASDAAKVDPERVTSKREAAERVASPTS